MSQGDMFGGEAAWAKYEDLYVLQTKSSRYVIRRAGRGSEKFRLHINRVGTAHYGSVQELMKVVDEILAVQAQAKGKE